VQAEFLLHPHLMRFNRFGAYSIQITTKLAMAKFVTWVLYFCQIRVWVTANLIKRNNKHHETKTDI
jgi:hypothetical protein